MTVDIDILSFTVWFSNNTKCIGAAWYRKPWKEYGNPPRLTTHYNGAKKGIDTCYDRSWIIGYLVINYTNFSY